MDGNKLRDTLRRARVFIDCSPLNKVEGDFGYIDRDEICAEIDSILAEPVKNCEVGTAEEQTIRFKKFCLDNRTENDLGCGDCPCYSEDSGKDNCGILWAQMPYEEGGANG